MSTLGELPERALCIVLEYLGSRGTLLLRLLNRAVCRRLTDGCPGLWHLVLKKGRLLATFEAARNLLAFTDPPDRRLFLTNTYFETRRWRTLPIAETRCYVLPVKQHVTVAINDPRGGIDAAGSRMTTIARSVVDSVGATANLQDRLRTSARIMSLCDRTVKQDLHFPIVMEPRPLRHRQLYLFWPFRAIEDADSLYGELKLSPIISVPLGQTMAALPPALAAPLTPPIKLMTSETSWAIPVDQSGRADRYKHLLLVNWASVVMESADPEDAVHCRICAHEIEENAEHLGNATTIFNFPLAKTDFIEGLSDEPSVVCLSSLYRVDSKEIQLLVGTSRGHVYFSTAALDSIQREAELICGGASEVHVAEVQLAFSEETEAVDCFTGMKEHYEENLSAFVLWADARVAIFRRGSARKWTQVIQLQEDIPFCPFPSYAWSPQMSQLTISGVPDKGVLFCHVSRRSSPLRQPKVTYLRLSGLAVRIFREKQSEHERDWEEDRMDSATAQKWLGEYRVAKPPIEMRAIATLNLWVLVVNTCLRVVQFRMPTSEAPAAIKVESVLIGHSRPIYRVNTDGFSRLVSISLDERLIIWDLGRLTKLSHIDLVAPPPPLNETPLDEESPIALPRRAETDLEQRAEMLQDLESFPALPSELGDGYQAAVGWGSDKKFDETERGNKYVEADDGSLVLSPDRVDEDESREHYLQEQEMQQYEMAVAASLRDSPSGSDLPLELMKEMASAEGMSVPQWLQAQGHEGRASESSQRKETIRRPVSLLSLHANQKIDLFDDLKKNAHSRDRSWHPEADITLDRRCRRRKLKQHSLESLAAARPVIRKAVDYISIDSNSIALYYSSLCAWQFWRFDTDKRSIAKLPE